MSREIYEVSPKALDDEWHIWDSCRIHGTYPGECECGFENFAPVAVVKRKMDEYADVD